MKINQWNKITQVKDLKKIQLKLYMKASIWNTMICQDATQNAVELTVPKLACSHYHVQ